MPSPHELRLSLGEWAVLGVVAEGPTHGFAVARLLGAGGALGRIWTVPRPVVYQALKKLADLELVVVAGTEASPEGPTRRLIAVSPPGGAALAWWMATPVARVRDVRSELLLKLALADRSGTDTTALISLQRRVVLDRQEEVRRAAAAEAAGNGFGPTLWAWRLAAVGAVVNFLDAVGGGPAPVVERGVGEV